LKAYERWQFASLDDDKTPRSRRAPAEQHGAAPPGPTAAELAAHELAVLRETARADGHTAGFAAGRAEGLEAATAEVDHLRRLASAVAQAFADMQGDTADALLNLAMDTARHVLRSELRTEPEAMLGAVREAVDLAGGGANPVLLLNPADIGFVQRHLGEDLTPAGWRLAEDARIEPGGCRVSTANGSIDATLKTRWQRAVATLGRDDSWDLPPAAAPVLTPAPVAPPGAAAPRAEMPYEVPPQSAPHLSPGASPEIAPDAAADLSPDLSPDLALEMAQDQAHDGSPDTAYASALDAPQDLRDEATQEWRQDLSQDLRAGQ